MSITFVWAFDPVPELGNGPEQFVHCSSPEQAARLLAEGKVQDPAVGAARLKHATRRAPAAPELPPPPKTKAQAPRIGPERELEAKDMAHDQADLYGTRELTARKAGPARSKSAK